MGIYIHLRFFFCYIAFLTIGIFGVKFFFFYLSWLRQKVKMERRKWEKSNVS